MCFHSGLCMIALIIRTLQFSPSHSAPYPGWSDSGVGGISQVTCGILPACTSGTNVEVSTTSFHIGPYRMCGIVPMTSKYGVSDR